MRAVSLDMDHDPFHKPSIISIKFSHLSVTSLQNTISERHYQNIFATKVLNRFVPSDYNCCFLGGDVPAPGGKPASYVIVSFLWLTYYVLAATYTANLIAFLSVTKVIKPVNSLEELANSGFKTGVIESSAHQVIFQVSKLDND